MTLARDQPDDDCSDYEVVLPDWELGEAKLIWEYYFKQLTNPYTGNSIYELHGNCYVSSIDTSGWASPTPDAIKCIMSINKHMSPRWVQADVLAVTMDYNG